MPDAVGPLAALEDETRPDSPDAPDAGAGGLVASVGATIVLQLAADGKSLTVTAFGKSVTIAEQ
jgi:hypothetical protein